jgi:hypothetical protein
MGGDDTEVFNPSITLPYPMYSTFSSDPLFESPLVCYINARAIHAVCSSKDDYLAIVTAYLPDPKLWSNDFKKRIT